LNTQISIPTYANRLDKALFWLRWLFLACAIGLLLFAENTLWVDDRANQDKLLAGFGVAAIVNVLLGLLTLVPGIGQRALGVLNILVDSTLATLFFGLYDGAVAPLLMLGTLAVFSAAFRFRWRGVFFAIILLVAGSAVALFALDAFEDETLLTDVGVSLLFLFVAGILGVVLRSGGWTEPNGGSMTDHLELEAARLRAARERARAIYEMATTLSATLDYQHVLEAAQDVGNLGLRGLGPDARLISAVLLFQGEDNKLRVVTARRLTRADEQVAVPGRRGVLGLALKQAEPVFAGDAARDPELRYFVAFQEAKSVLAIPLRAGFNNYGVLVFGSDQPNAFSDEHVELLTAIGTQATIMLQNAVLYQNILVEKERIVDVEEDARKKLARDLHDGPTQSVAAIAMRVNYIRRLIERQPQQAVEELWKVEELARRTTKEIRHMLFTLRPLVLETQGLVAALGQLVEKMRDTHNTNVILQGQANIEEQIDSHAQGVLFYIVEEAVNNARKHAQAEHIWVRLYRREAYVVVEIEDDGVGFDIGAVDANYDQRGSLGMVNMRERAELIEGTLRIQSAAGRGTKISILVRIRPPGQTGATPGDGSSPTPLQLQSQQASRGASAPPPPDEKQG
jgi:signal transduction histidine kinase